MKIEELSIGDWVSYDECSDPVRILGMDSRYGKCVVMTDSCYPSGVIGFIENVRPIPLTPEILEKNGFKRKQYTIDIPDVQEIGYDGYLHILCQEGVQYDIILIDSCDDYFDLEIESSLRNKDGDRILISSELSLNYVEYVHQLQHALRLVGIEKEVCL